MPEEMIFPPLQELELDLRMLPRFKETSMGSVEATAEGSTRTRKPTYYAPSYESSGP